MTFSRRLTFAVLVLFSGATIHLLDVFTSWHVSAWMEGWIKLGAAILLFSTGLLVLPLLCRNTATSRAAAEFDASHLRTQPTLRQRHHRATIAKMSQGDMRVPMDCLTRNQLPLQILLADTLIKEQRERRRLAKDFNDNLMQLLVVCLMKISQTRQGMGESRDMFTDLEMLLTQILQHSRRLMLELSPTALIPATLPMVLRQLAEQMRDRGLIVTVECGGDDLPVCTDLSLVIYQTVSELLFNVLKHAHTGSAVVMLKKRPDGELTVTVRDQGFGFDTASLGDRSIEQCKFGLFSIRERLTALGGELSIESAIGSGTIAAVVIPQWAYETNTSLSLVASVR